MFNIEHPIPAQIEGIGIRRIGISRGIACKGLVACARDAMVSACNQLGTPEQLLCVKAELVQTA